MALWLPQLWQLSGGIELIEVERFQYLRGPDSYRVIAETPFEHGHPWEGFEDRFDGLCFDDFESACAAAEEWVETHGGM